MDHDFYFGDAISMTKRYFTSLFTRRLIRFVGAYRSRIAIDAEPSNARVARAEEPGNGSAEKDLFLDVIVHREAQS